MFVLQREKTGTIKSGDLKVQVKNKKIRFFYKNFELTKNENLKFGVFYKKSFLGLFEGKWMLRKNSKDSLSICSEFKDLGLTQKVFIQLEPNQLKWEMEIEQDEFSKNGNLIVQAHFTDI